MKEGCPHHEAAEAAPKVASIYTTAAAAAYRAATVTLETWQPTLARLRRAVRHHLGEFSEAMSRSGAKVTEVSSRRQGLEGGVLGERGRPVKSI